jgi:hypothetical protein
VKNGASYGGRGTVWMVLILALAVLLRVGHFASRSMILSDEVEYLAVGEDLARGRGLPTWTVVPPAFPLAIALALRLGAPHGEAAGGAVSLIAGVLLVGILALLGRQLYGPGTGLAIGFLAAIYPPFIRKSAEIMSESMYMAAFFGSAVALLAGLRRRHRGYLGLAGLLAGVAYLTRPEGAVLAVLGVLAIGLEGWRKGWSRLSLIGGMVLFSLGIALVAVPYMAHVKAETGTWSASKKTMILLRWGEVPPEDLESQEALLLSLSSNGELQRSTQTTGAYVFDNVRPLIKRYLLNVYAAYWNMSKSLFSFVLIALIGIGFAAPPWDGQRLRRECVCLALLSPLLVLPVFSVVDRYLIPSAGVLLLWGGRGLQQVNRWIVESAPVTWRWPVRAGLVAMLLLIQVVPMYARSLVQSDDAFPVEWRDAGLWIRSSTAPDTIMLARRPEISYYARRQRVAIPYASLPEILDYAKRHGATVLALDERYTAPVRPQLRSLTSGTVPPGLALLHVVGSAKGQRVFIFRVGSGRDGAQG